ncbi:hypothetical protein [Clostridium lundense]|uniref:hypothetical protein n=1 Tax=Clostridium lundense TaxID=319475 RepID=UPI0004853AB1|nr:hypothetical protein [Clostridium lundense]
MTHKKPIIIISTLIFVVGIFSYMLFSKNGYKEYNSGESFANLIDLLLETANGKDKIDINEETINSIASNYLKAGIKKGNITINGFNADISKDKIKVLVPVKYKSLPLMVSSQGKLQLENNNLVYTPEYFKVGKISLPKEKVLGYIKRMSNDKLKIENGKFIISSNLFTQKIDILSIEDGKFVGKIKDNAKKIADRVDKAIKKVEGKEVGNKIEEKLNSNIPNSNSTTNKAENKSSSGNQGDSLGGKQSEMISIMNSTISKLDSNISYNYWPDVERVMSIYDTLSPQDKAKFKNQVFNYVDVVKAKEIKHRLGK